MFFFNLTNRVCEVASVDSQDEVKTQQNKSTLVLLTVISLVRAIRYIGFGFQPHEGTSMLSNLVILFLFIIVCRTKRWIFVLVVTFFSIAVPLVNTFGSKGFIFLNIELLVSFSVTILISTQSYTIATSIFIFQLFLINFASKEKMLEALYHLPPE